MENFIKEQKLFIKLTRVNIKETDISDVNINDINIFELFKYGLYHKTLTLCFKNFKKMYPNIILPKYFQSVLTFSYNAIADRNKLFLAELEHVVEEFKKNNLNCIPVKGCMLIPTIYKDYGIRYMGDMDCLIKFSEINKLNKVMLSMGYRQGRYNSHLNSIDEISRNEKIKWKMYMSNLYPYIKLTNNKDHPYFKFDFRFSLDDTLNKEPVNEIIDTYSVTDKINPAHVFVHLCTHFYGEAKKTVSIFTAKDFNLIKLCDIREYVINCMETTRDFKAVLDFINRYSLQKQIYFTVYCLSKIYNDGYEDEIINNIDVQDDCFINSFGENTINENNTMVKSFWDRLFSCNNSDELENIPLYFKNN